MGFLASAGAFQALRLAGRSPEMAYHFACISGPAMNSMNFQARALRGELLNITRLQPPMNEARLSPAGSGAVAQRPFSCGLEVSSWEIIQGPEIKTGK